MEGILQQILNSEPEYKELDVTSLVDTLDKVSCPKDTPLVYLCGEKEYLKIKELGFEKHIEMLAKNFFE